MEGVGLMHWVYVGSLRDLGLFCMEKAEGTASCVLTVTFWEGVEMIELRLFWEGYNGWTKSHGLKLQEENSD